MERWKGGHVRLDRALSKLGLASRTDAQRLIAGGRVSVRGSVVRNPALPVVPETAGITVDGRRAAKPTRRVIAFHKPRGVVTTRRDPEGRATVFDVLGEEAAGLVAVGRLDLASTGLLLLTSDTKLADTLTDPANAIVRRYIVTVRGALSDESVSRLARGIDGLRAERVDVRKRSNRETHVTVTLTEGKNREIRRLFAAVGHEVTKLKRVAFGAIELGTLQPGSWREVTRDELSRTLRSVVCLLTSYFLLLTFTGCAPRRAGVAVPDVSPWFELAGEFNIPPMTEFAPLKSARFGGVSGIVFDPTAGPTHDDLLGISDDRNASRLFIFRMEGSGETFRVDLRAYFPLPSGADAPASLDPEAIAMSRSGRIYVASEGVQNREPRTPPSITIYNRRVEYLGRLPVPDRFVPPDDGAIARGVRENGGFESLAFTPDEQHLFTAAELPLVQDGPAPTFDRGGLTRILEYKADGESFRPAREFAYRLDPAERADFTPRLVINGVVELLALDATDLLVMERSFAQEAGGQARTVTRIRIYRVSLEKATDVSAVESLARRRVRPARKTLLLDLADVKGLSAELAQLDNFEGMAFGPVLPDGSRSLVLVSDDNFSTRQRTAFLLFRIRRPLARQP